MQQWAIETIHSGNYIVIVAIVFAASVVEYLFPPFPGDTAVLFGAFLSGLGKFNLITLWLVSSAGSLMGALCLYYISFKKGRQFLMGKGQKALPPHRLVKLEHWFSQYGPVILVLNRFMPGFRPFFFVAAGLSAMKLPTVILYSTISILMWNGLLTYVGYTAGENWEQVKSAFRLYSTWGAGVAIGILAIFLLWRYVKNRK